MLPWCGPLFGESNGTNRHEMVEAGHIGALSGLATSAEPSGILGSTPTSGPGVYTNNLHWAL